MSIVFDYATDAGGATLPSFSHTCSGNSRYLAVSVSARYDLNQGSGNVTGITYAGDAMTELYSDTSTWESLHHWVYYITAPTSGSNTIITSGSSPAGTNLYVASVSYTGVDATTPHGTLVSTNATSSNISVNVTSADGEMVIDSFSSVTSPSSDITEGAGMTLRAIGGSGVGAAHVVGARSEADGATSVSIEYGYIPGPGRFLAAWPLKPGVEGKLRSIKYFHDINDPGGRIYDDLGRVVSPWDLKPNNWIRVTGLFLPTSTKYASFTKDPELAYIEEVTYSIRGGLRIKTNRGEMTEVLVSKGGGREDAVMAIVEGTQVTDADITFWNYYMTRPSDGTDGARSNVVTSGDSGFAAIQVDELAGKIGAIVEPYDPEGRNRMIQEF